MVVGLIIGLIAVVHFFQCRMSMVHNIHAKSNDYTLTD